MIRIRHKADWRPKTGERDIPMNSDMKDLLLHLRATRKPGVPYVFTIDGKPALTSDIRRRLMRIAKRAHVKDMTSIHALRHTFGSLLAKSGVALPIVQQAASRFLLKIS
ncbi:MAG: tyrosine-type recombinase/integrase [Candidatus Zixiibacteriota bacterium]